VRNLSGLASRTSVPPLRGRQAGGLVTGTVASGARDVHVSKFDVLLYDDGGRLRDVAAAARDETIQNCVGLPNSAAHFWLVDSSKDAQGAGR
jgi:hypothetical protein